jgi:hypothetical protein
MAPKQASGRVSRAKPAVQRPARRAAPPKSPKTETIPAKGGSKPITFAKGGLHKSLGVPQGQPIPAGKMADALAGKAGPKAKSPALFDRNVLKGGSKKKGK